MNNRVLNNTDMGRKSLAEVEARRNDVYEMMMQGKSKSFIVSFCATNWNVRLSCVEKDMTAVRQDLLANYKQQKDDIISLHINRYENLYCFYMDEGTPDDLNLHYDPEKAAKMLVLKEKLLKLHNPDVAIQNNTINLGLGEKLNDGMLNAIEELLTNKNGE